MSYFRNFTGCNVILYAPETRDQLLQASVLECDTEQCVISIASADANLDGRSKVIALLFHDSGIYEYQGSIRRARAAGRTDIALFHGQAKEQRQVERYPLRQTARVENLVICNKLRPLRTPQQVTLLNISTEGTLLRAGGGAFNVGTTFQLLLEIGGHMTAVNTTAVRMTTLETGETEYGCRFNFLYS